MTKSEIWQKHISDWKGSGLTQLEFCKTNNLKAHNFTYWKKQLTINNDQPKKMIPVSITRPTNARLLIGDQISIELPAESLPDLLLALKDRGLLHAAA